MIVVWLETELSSFLIPLNGQCSSFIIVFARLKWLDPIPAVDCQPKIPWLIPDSSDKCSSCPQLSRWWKIWHRLFVAVSESDTKVIGVWRIFFCWLITIRVLALYYSGGNYKIQKGRETWIDESYHKFSIGGDSAIPWMSPKFLEVVSIALSISPFYIPQAVLYVDDRNFELGIPPIIYLMISSEGLCDISSYPKRYDHVKKKCVYFKVLAHI